MRVNGFTANNLFSRRRLAAQLYSGIDVHFWPDADIIEVGD